MSSCERPCCIRNSRTRFPNARKNFCWFTKIDPPLSTTQKIAWESRYFVALEQPHDEIVPPADGWVSRSPARDAEVEFKIYIKKKLRRTGLSSLKGTDVVTWSGMLLQLRAVHHLHFNFVIPARRGPSQVVRECVLRA
jgi:hypothetical protein